MRLHRIGRHGREGRKHEAHARRCNEVGQHQRRHAGGQQHRPEADAGRGHADADHPARWQHDPPHDHLRDDERHAHSGQCHAGRLRPFPRRHAQSVDGKEAHDDLTHGHREQRRERRHHRAAQPRIQQARRLSRTCADRRRGRQELPQHRQSQCRQQRRQIERRLQPEVRELRRQCRPQHQTRSIGCAQRCHRGHAPLRRQVVGYERLAGRGRRRIEATDGTARQHQPGKDQPDTHRHAHGRHQPATHGAVAHEEAGKAGEHHGPAAQAVTGPAPDRSHQHPQHTTHRHGHAGLPRCQPQLARQRADDGDKGHHRHGAAHVGEQDRAQREGAARLPCRRTTRIGCWRRGTLGNGRWRGFWHDEGLARKGRQDTARPTAHRPQPWQALRAL